MGRVKTGVAASLVMSLGSATGADVQAAARHSVKAWAEFCVPSVLAGVHPSPPMQAVERTSGKSGQTVAEWWAGNGTILAAIEAKNGLIGCRITMSSGQRATVDSLRIVQSNFGAMMTQGGLAGSFGEVTPCHPLEDYFRTFESLEKNPNGTFVKVFLNTNDDLGFLLLVAAEADTEPHSCPEKEAS